MKDKYTVWYFIFGIILVFILTFAALFCSLLDLGKSSATSATPANVIRDSVTFAKHIGKSSS